MSVLKEILQRQALERDSRRWTTNHHYGLSASRGPQIGGKPSLYGKEGLVFKETLEVAVVLNEAELVARHEHSSCKELFECKSSRKKDEDLERTESCRTQSVWATIMWIPEP